MTWGDPSGFARWTPAKLAYGGAHGPDEEQRAVEASVAAGARPAGFRRFMRRFRGQERESVTPVVALLREIGAQHAKTPAQVALRWLIENGLVLPIPGAKNGKQATDNAGALAFSLTHAEIEALDRATTAWRASKRS